MKRILCLVLTMLLLASVAPSVMASDNIKVKLGGELIKFDVQPRLINSRTMVPLRAIFEALGASVEWDNDTQTVTSTKGDTTIKLTINNPTMYVNDKTVTLDSPACLVDGRTLVPVRAISEAFNLKVDWVNETKTVRIKKETSLMSESSFFGVTWSYTYDDNGREIERKNVTYPEIYVTSEYDVNDNLIKEKYSANGSSATYEYDENGNLIFEKNSDGSWIKNEYNDKGQKTFSSTSQGTWQKSTYDSEGRLIKDEYSPNEYSDGLWYEYEYNEQGVCINTKSKSNPNGFTVKFDERGNVIFKELLDKDSAFFSWYKYDYDINNNLIYETYGYDGDKENDNWKKYEYDKNGNLTFESDSDGYWKKYEYDKNGNLIFESDADGSFVKYIIMEI